MTNHFYMQHENTVHRLVREWESHGQLIVAFDFDNTVFDYHGEGHFYGEIVELLKEAKEIGAYLIVFSAAEEARYPKLKKFLEAEGIPYDAINENKPGLPFTGRKIYYNVLLDDRAGLESSYYTLKDAIYVMRSKKGGTIQCP